MALSETAIIEKLQKLFPSRIIFADQYLKRTGILSYEVYKIAKENKQTRTEWFSAHGFIWKETGYVESDMLIRNVEHPTNYSDAFLIADYVFRRYPLAGEYILTNEENLLLYQSANKTVKKILSGDKYITRQEEIILVLETIELLKHWSTNILDDNCANTFWKYIFMQYGFNSENSEIAEKRLYNRFRVAIQNTLCAYKRFFAPAGTQRYYTSLLLHSIAPKQSIESLFNILFDFYAKNLDFQYVAEDISYKVFTKGMQARWNNHLPKNNQLQLRSDTVFSGLQTLFQERPGYMAVLADSIVKKMDAMLRGNEEVSLDITRNYWDLLLNDWYNKKSISERVRVQGEWRQRKTEFVATATDRIYVQYALINEMIGIHIPKIRLSSVKKERPIIKIIQCGSTIFEDDLSVTGNDLCLTTKSRFIPLQNTQYNFFKPPHIQVEITYQNDILYQSNKKLIRNYILLDSAGNERTPKGGIAYLFASEDASIEFNGEDEFYQLLHPGQLYRINLSAVASVAVDGVEVFADITTISRFRHYALGHLVNELRVVNQGKYIDVYSKPFTLTLQIPEGQSFLRYKISVDGIHLGLDKLKKNNGIFEIASAEDNCVLHRIRVIDITDDTVKYEYSYIILRDCIISTDKHLYRSGVDTVHLKISWSGYQHETEVPLQQEESHVTFSFPSLPFQFELEIPSVQVDFMGRNAFLAPDAIWYKNIDSGETMTMKANMGWIGAFMLDSEEVPLSVKKGKFELGNMLRSMTSPEGIKTLWICLRDEHGNYERFKITLIIFTPQFLHSPLECRDGYLYWQVSDNYFGDPDSQFKIIYCRKPHGQDMCLHASYVDDVLSESCKFSDGYYKFQIFLEKKKSLFISSASSLMIYQGELMIGDPNAFAFEQKAIMLGNSLCWDFGSDTLKTVVMQSGCGIIRDLTYLGKSIASGESVPAPTYSGIMYFMDFNGNYHSFNSNPSNKAFELVNPVNLWIVNEHLLILHCTTDDAVYIDTKYSTIVNRSPDTIMTKQEQKKRLITPDYFEYEVREV